MREVAEQVLAEQHYVRPVDVLMGLRWVDAANVERWQQGRFDPLEQVMLPTLDKHPTVLLELDTWARERGLRPEQAAYVAGHRVRRELHFSPEPAVDAAFRTSWFAPDQPAPAATPEPAEQPGELLVIIGRRGFPCSICGTEHEPGRMLVMEPPGPVCLNCADLDHLEFLPSGHTALTRRSRKASRLSAVVVQWSRTRKRYERQGLLAEPDAIASAEAACLDDADVRERRRARDAERRASLDEAFVAELAGAIRDQFPGCPADRARRIAEHAGARSSGRIGRSRAGRVLDPDAVRLAVAASVRHQDTAYDTLLSSGVPRVDARARVRSDVDAVLEGWQTP